MKRIPLSTQVAVVLLIIHASLLVWIDWQHSPSVDEVAHLPSGISHWQFGRFDLYRVNPPLVRAVAAIPILLTDARVDWSTFRDDPTARPEFLLGMRFCELNGPKVLWYFTLARWACIPFSLLGAFVCWRWATDLYGPRAGLLSELLWCVSPNVLGNAGMITPDIAATSCGALAGYCFWRWLKNPSRRTVVAAGATLGIAELTKTTWIILFALWPALWLGWRLFARRSRRLENDIHELPLNQASEIRAGFQMVIILLMGLYVLNLGYGFEGSLAPLNTFKFISHSLGGPEAHQRAGNRFVSTWLGEVPVPVPANFLRGIDVQRYEFERPKWSYLRGEQKEGGWWYYYLYALTVKSPCGTLLLVALAFLYGTRGPRRKRSYMDLAVLFAPAVAVFILVSSQSGFSRFVRYVLPIAPYVFVWLGQLGEAGRSGRKWRACLVGLATSWSLASSLFIYPHSFSYFNEFTGGPLSGPRHLLDANIDWGQDLCYMRRWRDSHPNARPLFLTLSGICDPKAIGIPGEQVPPLVTDPQTGHAYFARDVDPGWYAINVNDLYDYPPSGSDGKKGGQSFSYLQQFEPAAHVGYTIRIYRLTEVDIAKIKVLAVQKGI